MTSDKSPTALFHPELQPALLTRSHPSSPHALCAELSRLAYWRYEKDEQDKPIRKKFEETLTAAGFDNLELLIDADTGTQGFAVTRGQDDAYVVFRGSQTDEPADIFIDGCSWPIPWGSGGFVHKGFLASYKAIEEKLGGWLAKHQSENVYFTGHSLGAAIATLAAAVNTQGILVTFGSPRVGDKKFAESFEGRKVFRYVNHADLVTRVPPALLPFVTLPNDFSILSSEIVNYTHVQGLRYLNESGEMKVGEAADTEFAQSGPSLLTDWCAQVRGMWTLTEAPILAGCLTDHAPVNYINNLIELNQ